MSEQPSMRISRLGCLAVHLMPTYHGRTLASAVRRIAASGPKNKFEQSAVLMANRDDCGTDAKLSTAIGAK